MEEDTPDAKITVNIYGFLLYTHKIIILGSLLNVALYLKTLFQTDEEDYVEDYKNVVPEHDTPFKRLFTDSKEHEVSTK